MKLIRWITITFLAATTVAACAADNASDDSSSDDDGGSSDGKKASVDFSCCINNTGYACPNNDAFVQCIGFDIDACMQGCAFDDFACTDQCFLQWEMSSPDPSACQQDAAVSCDGGKVVDGDPDPPDGGLCVGDWDGTGCDNDYDCSSNNCVNNKCYANSAGNPCDNDYDCTSNNCYDGCCQGTSAGDPCDNDYDCASNNCYENVCQ